LNAGALIAAASVAALQEKLGATASYTLAERVGQHGNIETVAWARPCGSADSSGLQP
jgi:hypothetical protein